MSSPLPSPAHVWALFLGASLGWSALAHAAAPVTDSATLQRREATRRASSGSDAVLAVAHPPPTTNPCPGVIGNGTVQLGVASQGHLYVPCATGAVANGPYATTDVGLRYLPTRLEGATLGIPCEGWGVASADLNVSGFTSASCGQGNVTVESFSASTTTALSVVRVGSTFRVTHRYTPSPATPLLYQVDVVIENIGAVTVNDLRYTRGIDYDVAPNPFSEYITVAGLLAPSVLGVNTSPFTSVDPLAPHSVLPGPVSAYVDLGPSDQGAHFDFRLGTLAPGRTRSFRTYYGAAANEPAALNALSTVGASTYSLGQADWDGTGNPLATLPVPAGTFGALSGQPTTFMYGFSPPTPVTGCTVECRINNPNEVYTVDMLGNEDICFTNGTSHIVTVAVFYNQGQRVEYNCGDYGPGIGNLCNFVPGRDTCSAAVYENICSLPYYSCQ
ncbi:hypothetical protein [Corallococcus aberystwythensis]|uniref:Uncharacterized protein n=1 Tax=Corallococcus aberystwythensis TaxID=2316722 RepID=A0A3A8PV91_9BACT|nr:hypothetical protein [Corallococcus aberystwythensis]RKH58940.1 hypothetical protein D7W81_28135 [Corallococcus aberystwythensis]